VVKSCCKHYFDKRTHQTRVGDCPSDEATLVSGVIVQGSGIGMGVVYQGLGGLSPPMSLGGNKNLVQC